MNLDSVIVNKLIWFTGHGSDVSDHIPTEQFAHYYPWILIRSLHVINSAVVYRADDEQLHELDFPIAPVSLALHCAPLLQTTLNLSVTYVLPVGGLYSNMLWISDRKWRPSRWNTSWSLLPKNTHNSRITFFILPWTLVPEPSVAGPLLFFFFINSMKISPFMPVSQRICNPLDLDPPVHIR